MPDHTLRIAHISDLHFDSTMSWPPPKGQQNTAWANAYRMLQQDLRKQQPDLLVITGDIANNNLWELAGDGLEASWRTARAFIEDTVGSAYGDALDQRVFVVPGNHDMKILGNITRDQLAAITKSRTFRVGRWFITKALKAFAAKASLTDIERDLEALSDPNVREALTRVATDPQKFHQVFTPYTTSRYVDDLDVYVLCVDSNMPADPLTNFAQGAVSPAEAARVSETVTKWREMNDNFDRSYKLALLHHHPMPIPLAEMAGLQESDSFHLMRNAGNFMRFCIENGIDFVLHGHKHAQGVSVVSLPTVRTAELPRTVAVIGAGSVYVPFGDTCSYNVLSRRMDQSWQVNVRSRGAKLEGISTFAEREVVTIVSPESYRRREWLQQEFPVSVGRIDILAMIDNWGDLKMTYSAKSVQPADGPELTHYGTLFSAESKRAAIEDVTFDDDDPRPSSLRGKVPIDPPATPHVPRDVEFGYTVRGGIVFSREYCLLYKKSPHENFSFGIGKRYDSLNVEVEFPPDFVPQKAWIDVVKLPALDDADEEKSVEDLLRDGKAKHDDAETAYCRSRLRVWAGNRRLSFHVDRPLPLRYYRIVWQLPPTEFDILPDDVVNGHLRSKTRAAVTQLRNVIGSKQGASERKHVHTFLENFCSEVLLLTETSAPPPLTVDISVPAGDKCLVVASMHRQAGGACVEIPSTLEYELGETLRGRAYLQRSVVFYRPGEADNVRSPVRHTLETETQHQIAVPLLSAPEAPFYPRIGVVTLSSSALHAPMFDRLTTSGGSLALFDLAHKHLRDLAQALQIPLPELPAKA